jgi:VIT1/CCC1 family predicted Fe2+/Mn2+ transporter
MHDATTARRVSNGIAIALFFLAGFCLGRAVGLGPWRMGVSMVAVGLALVGITIALGG